MVLFELKIGSVTSRCSKNEPTHPFPTPISKSLFSERSKTGPGSEGIEPKLRRDRKFKVVVITPIQPSAE